MTDKSTQPSPKPNANPTRPYKFSENSAAPRKPTPNPTPTYKNNDGTSPKPAANPIKPYKKSF